MWPTMERGRERERGRGGEGEDGQRKMDRGRRWNVERKEAKGEKDEEKVAIFCQLSELLCHGSSLYYWHTAVFTARGCPRYKDRQIMEGLKCGQ